LRKIAQTVLALVLLAAMALAVVWLEAGNETVLSGRTIVIDGDSLEINGERLRLWGLDAPELAQTCQRGGIDWKCGRESRAALKKLVSDAQVSCRTSGIDKYDRWLVECEADGVSINETLVAQGWAVAYGEYADAEDSAREQRVGIWSGEFEKPRHWRDARRGDVAGNPASATLRVFWIRLKRLVKSAIHD